MAAESTDRNALFLGLDSSTQGLKATLIDRDLGLVYEAAINFDRDLPKYGTEGGVHRHPDGLTVTSPPLMWVEALDLLLARMKADAAPLNRVAAISGSGQQHGSVWLNATAREALRGLHPDRPLGEQLAGIFSVAASPVWMDASTGKQCREREAALGGAQAVADLTGSRAFERFTGNQIARIHQEHPDSYAATAHIALVSSFMAGLLVGDYAPIDTSDGAGMNIMNVQTKQWDAQALACTAPGLGEKLGDPVPGHTVVGPIHGYFRERYGLAETCVVVAFSGDNPNSLAGLRLQHPGDIAISLGTSDTLFGSVKTPRPSATEGHVFANPVDPGAYMVMLVRQNGSLTRERIRDAVAGGSWEAFSALLGHTPPGNNGNIGFYVDEPEITPPILKPCVCRFDASGKEVDAFDPAVEARAVVESEFLALCLHGASIGLQPASILATGGASANRAIIRTAADVFGAPVYVAEKSDSASLGAAYRALHGWTCRSKGRFVSYAEVLACAPPFRLAAKPDTASHSAYAELLDRYVALEKEVVRRSEAGAQG